jgi:hypothetical protein
VKSEQRKIYLELQISMKYMARVGTMKTMCNMTENIEDLMFLQSFSPALLLLNEIFQVDPTTFSIKI